MKTASADSSVPAQDKSHYNLFNMTPPGLRRPFYTDYGALSPYTIDAGAYAADVSFGYGYRERSGDMVERTYTSWHYGNMWLKAGLLNNLDLEVGVQPWQTRTLTVKDPTGHDSITHSGFGDLLTRVKLNVLNNDGGPAALSFAATMKWPTANTHLMRRDDYEGGLSAQFGYQCPCGLEMRINSGFMLSESDRGCWESCFNNRIAFYHPVPFVADLSALAAFNSDVSNARRSNWEGEFQTGFIYQPTPNFQMFLGSTFGVNGKVNDFGPSVSMDLRFP